MEAAEATKSSTHEKQKKARVPKPKVPASPAKTPGKLTIQLSETLKAKLTSQAEEEGIAVEEYIHELLSESVTIRAWEIMEKKVQLRGGSAAPGNSPYSNNSHNNRNQGRQGGNPNNQNRNPRRMSQSRYNNIMDDKATFLEYVRNQERLQR